MAEKDGVHPHQGEWRQGEWRQGARVPSRVDDSDVRRLADVTQALRARDYRDGGGACRQAVLAELAWGHDLLGASMSDPVRGRLLAAVADLHNLAGWTSFDIGDSDQALAEYRHALELIRRRGQHDLDANIRYRLGRLHLHHRAPDAALTEFAHSRAAAERAGSDHAAAIVSVNQAWAHAMRGERDEAVRLLGRGQEEFARHRGRVPAWAAFFDATDLTSMIGVVHTELAAHDDGHGRGRGVDREVGHAIPALTTVVSTRVDGFRDGMRRSRTFCLTMLAYNHILCRELAQGARVAWDAVAAADQLASVRVVDRMQPLLTLIRRHRTQSDLDEITERIQRLTTDKKGSQPPPSSHDKP